MPDKSVSFSDTIKIAETWSSSDYDRSQINSIIYQKGYNKVPNIVWKRAMESLNIFKSREMTVHIDTLF